MALESEIVSRAVDESVCVCVGACEWVRVKTVEVIAELIDSRIGRVDVLNGNSAFNGAQSKAAGLSLLALEDADTAMLVLQRAVQFLKYPF